mmetsp:Transcript_13106/g.23746  ORF Transcript_13106/g.23746 Transcript_13106/m.23746 type:complete len:80 (-) Transcript_13106:2615-2854(-)
MKSCHCYYFQPRSPLHGRVTMGRLWWIDSRIVHAVIDTRYEGSPMAAEPPVVEKSEPYNVARRQRNKHTMTFEKILQCL